MEETLLNEEKTERKRGGSVIDRGERGGIGGGGSGIGGSGIGVGVGGDKDGKEGKQEELTLLLSLLDHLHTHRIDPCNLMVGSYASDFLMR